MAGHQVEDRTKLRRVWVDHAIQLAMQNRWTEAIAINRNILELFPKDVDALNRLGRALRELGQYREARDAYQDAVNADPNNSIAQKNLATLASVDVDNAGGDRGGKVDPALFVAEVGKSGTANLIRATDKVALAKMAVGDQVYLHAEGRALYVRNSGGDLLGQVEPRTAQRLIDLIRGGNKYAAALISLDEAGPRVIIRETLQHPSQVGKVSFPTRGESSATFRGYTKESLVKYSDFDEDDDDGDSDHELTPDGEGDAEEAVEPSEYEDDGHHSE